MADELIYEARVEHPGGTAVEASFRWDADDDPITVLFGPSGAGKTTILRAIAGLEQPVSGRIACNGRTWFDSASGVDLPPQQRRAGLLFQDYALFPHLSVSQNIAYGLAELSAGERARRVREQLEVFGLEPLAERSVKKLSGGERQRTALARTLAPKPELLLLDEPLSALDAPSRERLRTELRTQLLAAKTPALVVTHDRQEALLLGDRMGVVIDGKLEQIGPIAEVFGRPANAAVAHSVGVETVAPATVRSVDGGLAVLGVGTAEAVCVADGLTVGQQGLACIRGEDVVLSGRPPQRDSARNHLEARVREIQREGPLVRVRLDCGFELTALITAASLDELNLAPGSTVWAAVKAPAVHFVPHASTEGVR